jgi:hypothetical protein
MAIELSMPALSPTMEKGTLARWLVSEGDLVKPGDQIAEIETDKATMEFEVADGGRVLRLLVPAGSENVAVGTVIAVLGDAGRRWPRLRPPSRRLWWRRLYLSRLWWRPRWPPRRWCWTARSRPRRWRGGSRRSRVSIWARCRAAGRAGASWWPIWAR